MTYSVAIRTLGKGGEVFRRELEQLHNQTLPPSQILIYIAEGYEIPNFRVGREQYVYVPKGMMSQRLRKYPKITDPIILFLDDDVNLEPDSAERLITHMQVYGLDAISADTFHNHTMGVSSKAMAALSNWIFPHCDQQYAILLNRWGTFSYLCNVKKDVYLSHSCAGPSLMCRKEVFEYLNFEDELWLQNIGFAYGDDQLISYKFHANGYRLGIDYNCGITHLDSRTSSKAYKNSKNRFYIRAFANYTIWHRTIYNIRPRRWLSKSLFWIKQLFTYPFIALGALKYGDPQGALQYIRGLLDASRYVQKAEYISLSPYVIVK